jgi:dephospho-CoA kinase
MGAGKSTVAGMFRSRNSLLIDADRMAHGLLCRRSPVYDKLVGVFGSEILAGGKRINRKRLAGKAFSGKADLKKLNGIIHKALIPLIKQRIKDTRKETIILDAALLIEAGLAGLTDILVVVTAPEEKRIARSMKRLVLTRQEVCRRMKYQISQGEKMRLADFIIDNSGNIAKTRKQVWRIRKALAHSAPKGFPV